MSGHDYLSKPDLSADELNQVRSAVRDNLWGALNSGIDRLETAEEMFKLRDAFISISSLIGVIKDSKDA